MFRYLAQADVVVAPAQAARWEKGAILAPTKAMPALAETQAQMAV